METKIYLLSMNIHNFRHGKEMPRVIGFVNYTPKGLRERPCFKVEYISDKKIDYIPHSEILNGNWEMI